MEFDIRQTISGIILKRLVMDAQDHWCAINIAARAGITVPAYFGVAEKATYAAARIAGIWRVAGRTGGGCLRLWGGKREMAGPLSLIWEEDFDVAVVGMADRRPRIWAVDGETRLRWS